MADGKPNCGAPQKREPFAGRTEKSAGSRGCAVWMAGPNRNREKKFRRGERALLYIRAARVSRGKADKNIRSMEKIGLSYSGTARGRA